MVLHLYSKQQLSLLGSEGTTSLVRNPAVFNCLRFYIRRCQKRTACVKLGCQAVCQSYFSIYLAKPSSIRQQDNLNLVV